MIRWFLPLLLTGFVPSAMLSASELQTTPATVELRGNFAQTQLLVTDTNGDDATHQVSYSSADPKIATVSATGRVTAVADGETQITIQRNDQTVTVPVKVSDVVATPLVGFHEHILPIISKAGCNMGACHAAQYGQGGFKLSVFGFEPEKDWEAIVRERRQRRVNFLNPAESLLLKKPTLAVPHGGSRRLTADSLDHQILVAWLKAGAPKPKKDAAKVVTLTVTPNQRVGQLGMSQQLRVTATDSNGKTRDVTSWAKFDAMDDAVVQVTDDGLVTTVGKGQAPVMVRYEGQAEIAMFVVPYSDSVQLAGWKNQNFIDELAEKKFRELGIEPAPLCDDATFLRRAFLDVTGGLPTVEETRAFLASDDPNKREQLIDRLLGLTGDPALDLYNDRYAAFWTLKWSDLIRNTSNALGEQGMWALHNWLKESFRTNTPFDRMVRELVTAKGSIYRNGPANYYRINKTSADLTESTAQLFLGVRLQCAKCHHHPFEKYSQADYYGFSAFFSRVGTKTSEEFGLFGRESVVMVRSTGDVRHPRTRELMKPTPLEGEPLDHTLDRRIPLADWLTSKENDLFAQSVVNRYMKYLLGTGLVVPVDDLRATNPPSNPALMQALSKDFVAHNFDLKHLMRQIMSSRLYQLSSQPSKQNHLDKRFYSHFRVKRLLAEPLLDAVDQVTGIQTKFKSLPLGTRAIELPDAEYPNYFLTTFAKPRRASVCECERMPDESLAQALHTLNGDILATKIADKSARVAKLLAEKTPHETIIEELYLATLCRLPSEPEKQACNKLREESPNEKEFYEDLLWSLMNSKQFLFVR